MDGIHSISSLSILLYYYYFIWYFKTISKKSFNWIIFM